MNEELDVTDFELIMASKYRKDVAKLVTTLFNYGCLNRSSLMESLKWSKRKLDNIIARLEPFNLIFVLPFGPRCYSLNYKGFKFYEYFNKVKEN